MDKITRILEKLNQGRSDQLLTLADFMPLSLAEVRNKAGSRLSREEAQLLHRAAMFCLCRRQLDAQRYR